MARRAPASKSRASLLQSAEFVRLALAGVEQEIQQTRDRLATLQAYAAQLRSGVAGAAAEPVSPAVKPPRKRGANRLSPAARKALSERMTRKWAEFRKAKDQAAKKPAGKAKAQPAS